MLAYLRTIFSSDDCASFARYATLFAVLTGCYALIYLVIHNHALPTASDLLALAAWMTSPYAINKTAAAFTKPPKAE